MIIKFLYRNHREEINVREVQLLSIKWEEAILDYKHDAGYYLHTYDKVKNNYRSFDFARIIPQETQPNRLIDFDRDFVDKDVFLGLVKQINSMIEVIAAEGGQNSTLTVKTVEQLQHMLRYYK